MLNPKISIIIPIYNREKTLKPCISSILSQSYKNFELILVDNNSTDSTKEIIQEFQKKDKRIISLLEKEQGIGVARNTGEKHAKGKAILMTDSDCILPRDWIREMTLPLLNKECDGVQGFEKQLENQIYCF